MTKDGIRSNSMETNNDLNTNHYYVIAIYQGYINHCKCVSISQRHTDPLNGSICRKLPDRLYILQMLHYTSFSISNAIRGYAAVSYMTFLGKGFGSVLEAKCILISPTKTYKSICHSSWWYKAH